MAVSLVSTGVQFPDSTIQTTAASAGGTITGTASGSITAATATIVNSDGTISAMAGSEAVVGTASNPATPQANKYTFGCASDPATGVTIMVTGEGSGSNVWAMSVSGSTITWGAGVAITGINVSYPAAVAFGSNKFLLAYADSSTSIIYIQVATVSGTTVTLSTAVSAATNAYSGTVSLAYNPSTGTALLAYQSNVPNYGCFIRVISVSGTTPSAGAATTLENVQSGVPCVAYNNAISKMVVVWGNGSDSPRPLKGAVVTMSGTSCFIGTVATVNTSSTYSPSVWSLQYDATTQAMVVVYNYYNAGPGSNYAYMRSLTATATTITFGTAETLLNAGGAGIFYYLNRTPVAVSASTAGPLIMVGIGTASGQYLTYAQVNINTATTACTLGTTVVVNSTQSQSSSGPVGNFGWDALNGKFVRMFYTTTYGAGYTGGIAFNPPYSTGNSRNYLGISTASYTNGQTATITVVGGINTAVSGLTPGTRYYVQNNGTLGTTAATNNTVIAGLATAANKLFVRD